MTFWQSSFLSAYPAKRTRFIQKNILVYVVVELPYITALKLDSVQLGDIWGLGHMWDATFKTQLLGTNYKIQIYFELKIMTEIKKCGIQYCNDPERAFKCYENKMVKLSYNLIIHPLIKPLVDNELYCTNYSIRSQINSLVAK